MNKLIGGDNSEMQLQSRMRNDDKSALEYVYLTHKDAFINYAFRFEISKNDILDIYQESVIAMYQNFVLNKLQIEHSSLKTYLFGIGKNKIYKHLKAQQRFVAFQGHSDEFEEISLIETAPSEKQLALSKNIKSISESCQELLRLFYYRGLTIDEIVEKTDYKDSNTVRSHKSRCMKRLKTLFKVS